MCTVDYLVNFCMIPFSFTISDSVAKNLYTHGTSRPLPYFLLLVTSQDTLPPWLMKCQNTFEYSLGTCPTTVPSALSKATAFRSWGFPASRRTCTISPVLGVHIRLKIWWPRITLSWRKIESPDTGALVIFVLVCSTFTLDQSHVRLSRASSCGRGFNNANR